jgi:hypothetical protein
MKLGKININFNTSLTYDDGIYIVYSKKFDITGYGRTKSEAINAFKDVLQIILTETKPGIRRHNTAHYEL